MPREFSILVGINAGPAKRGGREFKRASDTVVRSSNRMTRGINRTQKRMTAMITTIGRLRGFLTIFATGFLGAGGIFTVIRTLGTFEASMKRVEALLGDRAVGGAMKALTERARELGATTAFTASQAAEGMQFLTLAGFDALETFQAIGPALDLAQAGMLGLGEASDIVSNIMQGFNIDASRTGEVVDALAFIATRTNTNIRQLGEAMKFVAPVAGAVGLKVDEVAAALGLLGNSGLQASLAGTSLRRVLSGLLNPSKEAAKVLGAMGLRSSDLVDALIDPEKGLVFVIKQLEDAGIGAAEAFTLFGQRGAPGLLSLIGQTGKLEKFNEQMQNIAGTARTIGKVMIDNLQGDARIALSAVQEAIIRLGEAGLLEFLRDTTQAFTAFVRGLADIDQVLDGSTEKVRQWAKAGMFMRDNVELLRKALIIFLVFLRRDLVRTIAVMIGRFALLGLTMAGLAGPFAIASASALVLKGSLDLLKAAIIATGLGALVIATGFLIDWIFFSKEAESQNVSVTESFSRLAQKVEDAAFKFKLYNDEQREHAILDIEQLIMEQEAALGIMAIQLRKSKTATERLTKAEEDLAAAQMLANQATEGTFKTREGEVTLLFKNEEGLRAVEQAEIELATAQAQLALAFDVTESGLVDLRAEVDKNKLRLDAYRAVAAGTVETVEEYIAKLNGATDANKKLEDGLREQLGLTKKQVIALEEIIKNFSRTENKISELTDSQEILNIVLENAAAVEKSMGLEAGTLARVLDELGFKLEKLKQKLSPLNKEAKEFKEKLQDLRDGTDKYAKLNTQLARDVDELVQAFIRGSISVEDYTESLALLQQELAGNRKELDEQCEAVDELKKCMTDSAKRIEAVWDQAMRNIQDAFADAFRGAFDSFGSFADALLEAMKTLVANLVAELVVSGLIDFFKGGATIKGPSGTTAGVPVSVGGLKDILAGGFAGLAVGLKDAAKKFLGAIKSFGAGFLDFFKTGAANTVGVAGTVGALAGAGLTGFASGSLTNQILGSRGKQSTTNLLSGIGGIVGGIFSGPIGAVLGGAIGSFVSNLFGGAKKLESATLLFSAAGDQLAGSVKTVVSKQKSFFRGKKFKTTIEDLDFSEIQEVFTDVLGRLGAVVEALGGGAGVFADFSFNKEIDIRGKTEEEITALIEEAFNETIVAAILSFINTTDALSDRFRKTVLGFSSNAEEFIRAFEAAASIDLALLVDPIKTVTEAIAQENKSLTVSYNELLATYRDVLAEFDGSIESLEFLALATGVVVTAQLELVAALKKVDQEISTLFQDSAQFIRESILSDEELFSLRKTQIDALIEQASLTADPIELASLAEEINRLGLDAFNLLDEDQRKLLSAEFIEFFGGLEDFFGDQIQMGLDAIASDNQAINDEVTNAMLEAAAIQNDAAIIFSDAVNNFVEGGGLGGSLGGGGGNINDFINEFELQA